MKRLLLLLGIWFTCQSAWGVQYLKQSTAATVPLGPFVDEATGFDEENSLTISQADIRLSKNGGAFAQTNNAAGATFMEKGHYSIPLDTTDTNTLGRLRVHVHEAGALLVWQDFMVVPANTFDSLISGTDAIQAKSTGEEVISAPAVVENATNQNVYVRIVNRTTGQPASGLTHSDITSGYFIQDAGSSTTLGSFSTLAAENTAHIDGGFKEISNQAGTYRLCVLDSAFAAGAGKVRIQLNMASPYYATPVDVPIVEGGPFDANVVSGSLSWNAAWDAEIESEALDAANSYGALKPTVASRTLDVTATGAAGIDWANVENPTTTLALTNTTTAPSAWNAAWDAEVESEVDDALGGGTGTALTAIPWNAAWDTEVQSEAADALVAIHLQKLFAEDYDPTAKPGVATALLNEIVGSDAGVSQFTANALELGPAGGGGGTDILTIEGVDATDTIDARVAAQLAAIHLDHLFASAAPGGGVPVNSSFWSALTSKSATPTYTTFNNTTDSLEAIRDNSTAAASAGETLLWEETTVATVASSTVFTLTTGPANTNSLRGALIVVYDTDGLDEPYQGRVISYTGSTKTVRLNTVPTFAIEVGDRVKLLPTAD